MEEHTLMLVLAALSVSCAIRVLYYSSSGGYVKLREKLRQLNCYVKEKSFGVVWHPCWDLFSNRSREERSRALSGVYN